MRSGFWTTPEQHVAALKGTDDLVGNSLADVVWFGMTDSKVIVGWQRLTRWCQLFAEEGRK